MTPMPNPIALQTAALRIAGYALATQMKLVQIMTRSAMQVPALQARMLEAAASLAPDMPAAFVGARGGGPAAQTASGTQSGQGAQARAKPAAAPNPAGAKPMAAPAAPAAAQTPKPACKPRARAAAKPAVKPTVKPGGSAAAAPEPRRTRSRAAAKPEAPKPAAPKPTRAPSKPPQMPGGDD